MKKVHGQCPECRRIYDVTASGTVKGLGALSSILLGVRLAHPLVAVGLTVVSLLWGDKIEQTVNAYCPTCNTALSILGEAYG